MFLAPSSYRAVDAYLQTLLLRVSLSRLGGKHRHHVLGLVKSYWPQKTLDPLGEGMKSDCFEGQFKEYLLQVSPIADRIVGSLDNA